MKLVHIFAAILLGALIGALWTWNFVFAILAPSIGVSGFVAFVLGLVAYVGFFAELGVGIGAALAVLIVVVLSLIFKWTSLDSAYQILFVEIPQEVKKHGRKDR